jgi:hypothetical protein
MCVPLYSVAHHSSSFSTAQSNSSPLHNMAKRDRMIDEYINQLLKNPELNIKAIPDVLERRIYKFTIMLTLDAIYSWIYYLDGLKLLGHKISVNRSHVDDIKLTYSTKAPIDKRPLESFVTSLLNEKMINLSYLPDFVERQIYTNCLILMFNVSQSFLASTSIEILGHALTLQLVPSSGCSDLAHRAGQMREGVSERLLDALVDSVIQRYRHLCSSASC